MGTKFILIKEYPGSHPVGTISKLDYSKYPEFWKEYVELDFQVLSIISHDGYIKKGKEIIYGYAYGAFPGYKIHSVKRLSDGEIFTIGDMIVSSRCFSSSFPKSFPITKFEIYNSKLLVSAKNESGGIFNHRLDNIKKSSQFLFKTEDGVDVFEPIRVWTVVKKSFSLISSIPTELDEYHLYFISREKAEEYIKMNKKEFSRAQVIELLNTVATTKELTINFNVVNNGIN